MTIKKPAAAPREASAAGFFVWRLEIECLTARDRLDVATVDAEIVESTIRRLAKDADGLEVGNPLAVSGAEVHACSPHVLLHVAKHTQRAAYLKTSCCKAAMQMVQCNNVYAAPLAGVDGS